MSIVGSEPVAWALAMAYMHIAYDGLGDALHVRATLGDAELGLGQSGGVEPNQPPQELTRHGVQGHLSEVEDPAVEGLGEGAAGVAIARRANGVLRPARGGDLLEVRVRLCG